MESLFTRLLNYYQISEDEYHKKKDRLYELRENYKKYMELDIDDLKSQINQLNNKCNIIVKVIKYGDIL